MPSTMSNISTSSANRSLRSATPNPMIMRKRVASIRSTDSTPGADRAMKCGSSSRRHTCSRVARISGAPENSRVMDRLAMGVSYTACFPAVTTDAMRIALFSEVYWPMVSGVAVTLRRLADSLTARGHEVRVYSATYQLPAGCEDRPEARRSRSVPLFLYPDVQWAFPRFGELLEDVAAFRPDIVHVATEFSMGLAGAKIARRLGVPLVASAHTNYDQYAGRYGMDWLVRPGWHYLRWFYGQADVVLCPSRFYQGYLEERGIGRTALWTRGVDTDTFSPRHRDAEYRSALGAGPDDLLVTYVGRTAREKNLDLLLDAWSALGERRRGGRLALVGRGP